MFDYNWQYAMFVNADQGLDNNLARSVEYPA